MATFTEVIETYRGGKLAAEASERLGELVAACHEHAGSGTFTLTLTVVPDKHGGAQTEIAAKIKLEVPRRSLPKAMFFADAQGNLDRSDPTQREMFGEKPRAPRPHA